MHPRWQMITSRSLPSCPSPTLDLYPGLEGEPHEQKESSCTGHTARGVVEPLGSLLRTPEGLMEIDLWEGRCSRGQGDPSSNTQPTT